MCSNQPYIRLGTAYLGSHIRPEGDFCCSVITVSLDPLTPLHGLGQEGYCDWGSTHISFQHNATVKTLEPALSSLGPGWSPL